MQFLNPALLAGALLFAVPLIIHLLNRQRHKRRDWAAMEFLLRAYQKTRNRLRAENLLLLLLRCLIPIVLALAIARPILRGAGILGSDLQSAHHIAVLDASYSMGYERDGAPSPFERGRTPPSTSVTLSLRSGFASQRSSRRPTSARARSNELVVPSWRSPML